IDGDGIITDRRAGRLPTEEAAGICELLMREVTLDGAEFFLQPEREHRGLLVLRGPGLARTRADTDPQGTRVPPPPPPAPAWTGPGATPTPRSPASPRSTRRPAPPRPSVPRSWSSRSSTGPAACWPAREGGHSVS